MVNYVKIAATAKRLIEANGRTVSLVRLDRDPADPDMPWRGPAVVDSAPYDPLDYPSPKAVIVPYTEDDIDGTLVRHGDKRAYVAATSTAVAALNLAEYDGLIDNGEQYKIVSVNILNPGEIIILYEMQLRK